MIRDIPGLSGIRPGNPILASATSFARGSDQKERVACESCVQGTVCRNRFRSPIKPGWSCWTGCVPHPSRFVPPSLASQDFWSRAWGRAVLTHYHLTPRYTRLRERGLLTLADVAQALGISTATVKHWARGAAAPNWSTVSARASRASVRRSRWRRSGAYRRARRQAWRSERNLAMRRGGGRARGGATQEPQQPQGFVPHPSRFVPPSLASQDFWSRATRTPTS